MKTSSLFRIFWRIAIALMILSPPARLGAQNLSQNQIPNQSQTPPIRFSHLTPDSGLSSHHIGFIHQDAAGFIWIGTPDGLNRYGGYNFKVFRHDPKDPHTLSSNTLNKFWADEDGILWLGTQRGLNRFDLKTHAVKRFFPDDPLVYNPIWALWGDADGMLWVGTRNPESPPGNENHWRPGYKK